MNVGQLLLLSKFLQPRLLAEIADKEYVRDLAGSNPRALFDQWRWTGLLEVCPPEQCLEHLYRLPELKRMLAERGLKLNGKKEQLVARLLEADPVGMKQLAAQATVLRCSQSGKRLAEEYLAQVKEQRARAELAIRNALSKREFEKAARLVAAFEANQPIKRGLGIDWSHYNPASDVSRLRQIFTAKPAFLSDFDLPRLEQVRLAAAQKYLWGEWRDWLPDDFSTGSKWAPQSLARALEYNARFKADLAEWRASRVVRAVAIQGCNDHLVCANCRAIQKRKWKLENVPELPYLGCTNDLGCRCWAVPQV